MVSSLYCFSKYLTPCTILTFTRDRCGRKWTTAATTYDELPSLYFPVSGSKASPSQTKCCKTFTALLLCYVHRKCSGGQRFLVTPVLTFTAKSHHATHNVADHSYSLCIPLVRYKFHSSSFFWQATALWNHISRGCFSNHYNLSSPIVLTLDLQDWFITFGIMTPNFWSNIQHKIFIFLTVDHSQYLLQNLHKFLLVHHNFPFLKKTKQKKFTEIVA